MDLTAVATLALVAVTLWLVWETRVASKRQIGVQTWLTLLQRFDSNEMKQARKRLVPQLSAYDRTKHDRISETVLNFFEDVGTAHKLGYLDSKLADSSFSYYAVIWWEAAKPYVDEERRRKDGDQSLFEDFERFANKMRREPVTADLLQAFLADENRLKPD
jgi:Domain of unknown function (DUF4760)